MIFFVNIFFGGFCFSLSHAYSLLVSILNAYSLIVDTNFTFCSQFDS